MRKLSYIIICIALLLGSTTVKAQRIHAFVNAGVIGAQIEGDELKGMDHWGLTGGVGAIANLDDNGRWAIAVETDYSSRGVYHNSYDINNYYNIKLSLHYVDIPLTLYFRDPYGGMQFGAGLVYGRLVSQPHGVAKFDPESFIPDTTDMTFLKNDLSPAIELRFNIWKGLQFSARYQFSIIKVKKDWHYTIVGKDPGSNDFYNRSIQLRLLWQFGDEDTQYGTHKKSSKKRRR